MKETQQYFNVENRTMEEGDREEKRVGEKGEEKGGEKGGEKTTR